MTFAEDIVIRRGAVFEAVGWVLREKHGEPLRAAPSVEVSAPVRLWRAAAGTVALLPCSVQTHTFAGQYDDRPVAVAQLDDMSPAQTAALDFERGYWSMLVGGEYVGGGRVAAPRVAP